MHGLFFSECERFARLELGVPPEALGACERRPLERYPEPEFHTLIDRLAECSGRSRAEVLRRLGRCLFGRLVALFPVFFEGAGSALDLLADVERTVHDEVRRLNGRLDPPRLECRRPDRDRIEIVYRSARGLADLAEGLILGCAAHFDETLEVTRAPGPEPGAVRFSIRGAGAARGPLPAALGPPPPTDRGEDPADRARRRRCPSRTARCRSPRR